MDLSSSSFDFFKPLSLNQIFFQDHLYISSIDFSRILITLYRNGIPLNKAIKIQKLMYLFTFDYLYFHYIIPLVKSSYPLSIYYPLVLYYIDELLTFDYQPFHLLDLGFLKSLVEPFLVVYLPYLRTFHLNIVLP